MLQEIKTYRFTCDRCGVDEDKLSSLVPSLPEGWGRHTHYPDKGYTVQQLHLCPKCLSKQNAKTETK